MITARINVNEIDKNKLYKGKKGVYLDVVLIETPDNEYGNDFMIVQEIPKEEREAGKKGNILGNAKILVREEKELTEEDKKDLPF